MLVECGQYKSIDKFDYAYSGLDGVARQGHKKVKQQPSSGPGVRISGFVAILKRGLKEG